MPPKTLIQNALRCLACSDVIVSYHVHDFKYCKCGKIFVDGGLEYSRMGGDLDMIESHVKYDGLEDALREVEEFFG